MNRLASGFGAAAAGLLLLAAVPAGTFAAHPAAIAKTGVKLHARAVQPLAFGIYTGNGSTATIATPFGTTVTVNITAKTKFVSRDKSLTAIANGDQVVAYGNRKNGNARRIAYDNQVFAIPGFVVLGGTATGTGTTLSLTVKSGRAYTVDLGTKTRIRVSGQKATSLPALTSTDKVQVKGKIFTDGHVQAALVRVKVA